MLGIVVCGASRSFWPADTVGLFCFQVFGDKDEMASTGVRVGARWGYIPCNMVAEVAMDTLRGHSSCSSRAICPSEALAEGSGMTCSCPPHRLPPTLPVCKC